MVDAPWLTVFTAHAFLGLSPLLLLVGLQHFAKDAALNTRRFRYVFQIALMGYLLALLMIFQSNPLSAPLLTALFSAAVFSVAIYCLTAQTLQPALPRRMLQVLFSLHWHVDDDAVLGNRHELVRRQPVQHRYGSAANFG